MPIRRLPDNPDVEHLRNQAKALQRQVRDGDARALELVREFHPRAPQQVARADALLVVARSYGFASWPALRATLDAIERFTRSPHQQPVGGANAPADDFLLLACLTYSSDDPARWARARRMLAERPELAGHSISTAAAVGDVAAAQTMLEGDPGLANRQGGPHRWEPLLYLAYSRIDSTAPGHSTLEVARLLLERGADPDAGFLWDGLTSPFTVLTGAFGGGEGRSRRTSSGWSLPSCCSMRAPIRMTVRRCTTAACSRTGTSICGCCCGTGWGAGTAGCGTGGSGARIRRRRSCCRTS